MSETTDIKINELMNKIVQCTGGKRVAILEGFVSSMDEDIIKLHPGLNPSRYVEIPRDSLLHSTTIDDELGNRCKLWVEFDTKIVMVRRDIISMDEEVTDAETGEVAMHDIFELIPEMVRSGYAKMIKLMSCFEMAGRWAELIHQFKEHKDDPEMIEGILMQIEALNKEVVVRCGHAFANRYLIDSKDI